MQDHLLKRIDELVAQGTSITRSYSPADYWIIDIMPTQAWMSSAANAIQQLAPLGNFFRDELARLLSHEQLKGAIPTHVVEKLLGLLHAIKTEAQAGLLVQLEYQVIAGAFDDFLDYAATYHRSGRLKESAVLVSVVLEDTMKRLAKKSGISPNGMSLEPLIDELSKANVFTQVKAKRIKPFATLRNHALHAEWDQFDLRDVGLAITGVRDLLSEYLAA
jgi:uncharacterized protein YutE (UPF0331/DUF86 family)